MSKYAPLFANPSDLETVLNVADVEDLCILVDYITDNGAGRIALDGDVNKKLSDCSKHKVFIQADRDLIAQELLLFGGNTIANTFRKVFRTNATTISYAELVQDVAQGVNVQFLKSEPLQDIERAILTRIFMQAFEKMSEAERKPIVDELGIARINALRSNNRSMLVGVAVDTNMSLYIATLAAYAVSTQVGGDGVLSGVTYLGSSSAATLLGSIGIAATALRPWTDIPSPAYRVTLPCVVHVAYMRQKYLAALNANK